MCQAGGHVLRVGISLGEEGLEGPVLIHEIEQRGVIHRVFAGTFRRLDPVVTGEELVSDRSNLVRCARQADEIAGKGIARHIARKRLRRVAFGIDGDQQGLRRLDIFGKLAVGIGNPDQCAGADIRAIGETEIDQRGLALEVFLGDGLSLMVREGERPADFLVGTGRAARERTARCRLHRLFAAAGGKKAGKTKRHCVKRLHARWYVAQAASLQAASWAKQCRRI